jgi:5S rRNA maturation endonuclease (ribonuclease M5)
MTEKIMAKQERKALDPTRNNQYRVGDRVEVYCDHDREGKRIRDWLAGVVVQADEKMVAVQFNEDVYLTDGWMVPDRVLWTQHDSDQIRPAHKSRKRKK